MNAVCNGYVNQWRLYICLCFGEFRCGGASVLFLYRKSLNRVLMIGMKDMNANMPSILVVSLLERSCINNDILVGLIDISSSVDFFAVTSSLMKFVLNYIDFRILRGPRSQ